MSSRPEHIVIDFSSATTSQDVHKVLFEALKFPDYYGFNWDAFDEVIRDCPMPKIWEIHGSEMFKSRLPREYKLMVECLRDYNRDRPSTSVDVQWK